MALETLTHCPVCHSEQFSTHSKVKDYTVSQETFQIQACKGCGFLFTNPRPDAASIGEYYQSEEYISHHDEARDLMSKVYNGVRNYTTRQKIALLNQATGNHRGELLDVGCGTGFFLSQCKADGWQVAGTEPDDQARKVAQGRGGANVFKTIEDPFFDNRKFQAITMWHVLEHVHRLNETLDWLHAHLDIKATLIIAVPNHESQDAQRFKEYWAAYDVPRHLYHFAKGTMRQLMEKHGFRIQQVQPMWFDSYYVSMLSTKYQRGQTSLPESFMAGSLSNWRGRPAGGTLPNTSSLIYSIGKA
ncbi:class I SAM-dependent methyltransferase [Telluribacter sp.]|jgi:2-polyprenyl-3-methyl-5-hydroxy-6-metoxy-1,4-benzoquinol methylase|uniref:class I SAM-dependent methyltransferase n=1 Tax=Telluribacter sp. TaxID=1978767 RepID=UPI002E13FAE1|nr:class I SAM-dependent methyltransferase [Telluribacter sp.]